MVAAVRIATFPFRVIWRLVSLLFLPVVITAVTWWIAGAVSSWSVGITLACGVWALVLVRLWWTQTTGELRSLARGTVRVDTPGRSKSRRRSRAKGGLK